MTSRSADALRRVVLAPSAPLVLAAVSPAQADEHRGEVGRLRALRERALAALDPDRLTWVLATGETTAVHTMAGADLRSLGLADVRFQRRTATAAVAMLADALAEPASEAPLGVDAAILVASAPESAPVVAIEVAAATDPADLLALTERLVAVIADGGEDVQVLVAGDLSTGLHAGSPRHARPRAADRQRRAVAAVEAVDPHALAGIGGPDETRDDLRSWAPLTVALGMARAAGLTVDRLDEAEARGVGHVVGVLA